jgi:trimeric autotransporter adhesin
VSSARSDRIAIVCALLLALSCGESSGPSRSPVARIVVTPDSVALAVRSSVTATARVLDADGRELTDRQIFWSSEYEEVVGVDDRGRITAIAPGSAGIAASSEGKSAVLSVTVRARVVASVRVNTANLQLVVGQASQLTASPLDANGDVILERTVNYGSSNPAVASVTNLGLVTALSSGTANITASSGGQSAIVTVTVAAVPVASIVVSPTLDTIVVGQTTQLAATARDAGGSALAGRVITWRSSDDAIAAVSSAGLVTAVAPGAATVTAAIGNVTSPARVVVRARPVASVIVSPSQVSLAVGATTALTALVTDAQGTPIAGKTVSFSSNATGVATVSAAGVVTGVAEGTARITATSDGQTGISNITVIRVPVAAVRLDPSSDTIVIGQTTRLTATPESANGTPLTGRAVAWQSGAPTIATVSANGTVSGVSAGIVVILATSEGRTGASTILVQRVAVSTVTIVPGIATLAIGGNLQLTATARDASGNVVAGCAFTWSSGDDTVAVVSSSGRVVGQGIGGVLIRAVCENVTGSATITVR